MQVSPGQVIIKLPYRSTGMGALTLCRVYDSATGSRVEPVDVERSRTGSHGYDIYILDRTKTYSVKCIEISNSGKKTVRIGEIIDGKLMWNYVGPLYG